MILRQIVRSLYRDRLNTFIMLISLAAGIACMSLISMFISGELNTDSFQKNIERIYLLKCDNPFNTGERISACRLGGPEYMKANYLQVEDFCRVAKYSADKIVANGQEYFDKPEVYEASPNFFNFFSYKLLTNNPNTVLETKEDLVISEELASRYFGTMSPVGQVITLRNQDKESKCVIKGVFQKPQVNSLLSFDMIKYASESERTAFVLLKKGTDPGKLEKLFAADKDKIPVINDGIPGKYYLENMKDVYFDPSMSKTLGPVRDKSDLWIGFVIGFLILCVASVNFLGLVNNKLLDKIEEHSIRRINGGSKVSLIADFIAENLIIILLGFFLSLGLMIRIMPFFNGLVSSSVRLNDIFQPANLIVISALMLFFLLITLAFSLIKIKKRIDPLVLKTKAKGTGKTFQIPAFNIFQLAVTIILLICSIIIMKQMNYITNKDIGLDKNVIEVRLPAQYSDKTKVFREEILRNPEIGLVSVTTASPLLEYWMILSYYKDKGEEKKFVKSVFWGDENFINTLGIKLLEGRNFSGNEEADKNNCIVNESLARMFPGQDLVGARLPGEDKITVIGIVKDFHYNSLKSVIGPCYIAYHNKGYHLLVKPAKGRSKEARIAIEKTWKSIIPDYPLDIETVHDRYEWYHRENEKYSKLAGSCCLISLFLSMTGLFAVSYHSSRRRIREIGIRKVNGAKTAEVIMMLNKSFISWTLISFTAALPVAWFVMHKWLESFAYKTDLSWWIFALAGLLATGIALLTVSWQSWKAATRNPVDALRYE